MKEGDILGPYEIRGFIGQGGMGQVFRAFDTRLERPVALKVITVPAASPPRSDGLSPTQDPASLASDFAARLLREARAVASLNHPNVVGVYDVGESNGSLYLAMEHVVGSTLRALVGVPDIPVPRKIRWLIDIARALDAAHRAGLVHRDVKPENVMIREDGVVKVLDFGIARRTLNGTEEANDTITGGSAIAGTPVYMAPEQIRGGEVNARSDQFAWGVVAFELLAGHRPWAEGDVLNVVAKMISDPPPSLRALVKDLPHGVEEVIERTLAKKPEGRFPTLADVADALEPFAMQSTGRDRIRILAGPDDPTAYAATTRVPTTTSVPPAESGARKKSSLRRPIARLGAPIALLAALVTSVVLVRHWSTRPPDTLAKKEPRPLSTVPDAEAAYREGMLLWHDGAVAKSRAALRHAVELDPTFSAAFLELALQASNSELAGAQQWFQSAFEHRQMLVARDATFLDASEPYVRSKPDVQEWETRLTSAVFRFPRDPELQYYLGRARELRGDFTSARDAFEASIRLDSGFIPGLAALADNDRNLGRIDAGLEATERCLKRSPVASVCRETRFRLLFAVGECHRAREEATQWATLEPQSPHPFGALARALHADAEPKPAVAEALSRRWTLLPEVDRKSEELADKSKLAVLEGDLVGAEEVARDVEAALPITADAYDHAQVARLRVLYLMELDRTADAAKVARAYLDREAAWAPYPFLPDPSIDFYEPLYRASELTRQKLDEARSRWLSTERDRTRADDRVTRSDWPAWASVWGAFAATRPEALEALNHLPAGDPPIATRRSLGLDFALGRALVLAERPTEAIPHLLRVTATCSTFDGAVLLQKARLQLGYAYAATGEAAAATAAFETIVDTWPNGPTSTTVIAAKRRLAR